MKNLVLLCVVASVLTGCHKSHSVSWYEHHPQQLSEVLKHCAPDNNSSLCNKASEAKARSIMAAPPVKFNGEND
ncbi:EexN family lipoprotein [Acidocella aminolytica]|uniref:EexN family lipoprotein n=1 Tax=Acidocella aminolytica 101 = DSM 11237 TaxID=1120923 RepID=A0A0D6PFC9_9PROT|nr:EexN family lipoprotein [Acidocella aminolytica]GAN80372.1 hypothetical protein Aam_046_013 [Acidocella aminolytica 101 = DSM 11237]SHF59964.1 hypothetical protein SAMN02746095_03828 [Acidocella aminolytica 101 = DSM 11237]